MSDPVSGSRAPGGQGPSTDMSESIDKDHTKHLDVSEGSERKKKLNLTKEWREHIK